MKILEILNEGMKWNGDHWIGGASDEGHDDFDPFQYHNRGMISKPRYYNKPKAQPKEFVAIRVPFAVKDAFKEVVGKGNYAWDVDHKTWKINAALLTPEMKQRLGDMGITM